MKVEQDTLTLRFRTTSIIAEWESQKLYDRHSGNMNRHLVSSLEVVSCICSSLYSLNCWIYTYHTNYVRIFNEVIDTEIIVLVYSKPVASQHQIVPIFLRNEGKLARKILNHAGS